jgi:transposase
MKAFKPRSPPSGGGAGWSGVLSRLSSWLADRLYERRLGECFKKLKHEHHDLGFMRFYLATKCPDLNVLTPDWKRLVYLFHLHNTTVDPDDHLVIRFLRWLGD